ISAASHEQTAGIEQVNQAIAQMDETTQQNAALVEETSAAAEAMRGQAERLAQAVSVFRMDAMAAAAATPSLAAAVQNRRVPGPKARLAATRAEESWEAF